MAHLFIQVGFSVSAPSESNTRVTNSSDLIDNTNQNEKLNMSNVDERMHHNRKPKDGKKAFKRQRDAERNAKHRNAGRTPDNSAQED